MATKKKTTKKKKAVKTFQLPKETLAQNAALRKSAKKNVKRSLKRVTRKAVKKATPKKRAPLAKKKVTRKVIKKSLARKPKKKTVKRATSTKKTTKKRVVKKAKSVKGAVQNVRRGKEEAFLEAFVGSPVRARLLRLVYRQPNVSHELRSASREIGMPLPKVRREAEALAQLKAVTVVSRGGKRRIQASSTFPHIREVEQLATGSFPISRDELIKTLKPAGALKMVIVAGVFLNDSKARTDLLVVTGRYSEKRLERAVAKVEQAVASELRWAGMDIKEFKYRWKMFDRFVRDILTHEHERIIDSVRPK